METHYIPTNDPHLLIWTTLCHPLCHIDMVSICQFVSSSTVDVDAEVELFERVVSIPMLEVEEVFVLADQLISSAFRTEEVSTLACPLASMLLGSS